MKYQRKSIPVEAVQWNPPGPDGRPRLFREADPHPAVRGTSYTEVAKLLGTSGCSKEPPYWDWAAMGVIETKSGPHTISPGDWIIAEPDGSGFYPCAASVFERLYEPVPGNL